MQEELVDAGSQPVEQFCRRANFSLPYGFTGPNAVDRSKPPDKSEFTQQAKNTAETQPMRLSTRYRPFQTDDGDSGRSRFDWVREAVRRGGAEQA